MLLLQIRYSLVVILELNGVSEVQYKDVIVIRRECGQTLGRVRVRTVVIISLQRKKST